MMTRLAVLAAAAVLGATPLAAADRQAEVTSLSVDQTASAVELNIQTRGGTVEWADFTLENPARLVVDLRNARSALTRSQFDGIRSAGVLGVRSSQYEPGVVRVVVDLDRARSYSIDRNGSGVRISIEGSAGAAPAARTASREQAAPAEAPVLAAAPSAIQEPRISVRFEQADIRDVLATFAEFANRSIVPGSGVSGTVTAEIRNQPWDVAMETILRAYGLAAQELPSGIIRVDAMERLREREELDPLVTQTFRINYVPVGEIQTTLQPLLSARGRISISPSTNTLIITDVETVIDNVRMMANQLDIRTPQVAIQAKIAYIERTEARRLGFSYDFRTRDAFDSGIDESRRVRLGGDLIAGFGDATIPVDGIIGGTGGFATAIRLLEGRVSLTAFIDALEESRLVDVQAHPLVTTLDNQEAEILVGQRIPIRVVDVGGPGTVGGARATVQIEEAGTRLVVTPTITPDRRILLQLAAERSGIAPDPGDIGVIIDTQEGRTRMLVENGETAVLGGLTETQVNQVRSGIPYLMNIPGIGALFRTTATEERKRDLLILVTPRIIEERN
jgi:type IV pilus assembly protein PilQ